MNKPKYRLLKITIIKFLFCIQMILLGIGKIIYWIACGSILIEKNTIGGAKISDLLFVPPSEWLENLMWKIARIGLSLSGTKIQK